MDERGLSLGGLVLDRFQVPGPRLSLDRLSPLRGFIEGLVDHRGIELQVVKRHQDRLVASDELADDLDRDFLVEHEGQPGDPQAVWVVPRRVWLFAYSGDLERPIRSIVNTWSANPEHAPDLA